MATNVVSLRMYGDKELAKGLRELGDKEIKKANRSGVGKSMTPVLRDAKRNARSITYRGKAMNKRREYAKSLTRKSKSYQRGHVNAVVIGARSRKDADGTNWAPLSHLIEKGVRPHALGKGSVVLRLDSKGNIAKKQRAGAGTQYGSQHPGLPAKPHIRPAWDANRGKLVNTYARQVRVKMEDFARKTNAKTKAAVRKAA